MAYVRSTSARGALATANADLRAHGL